MLGRSSYDRSQIATCRADFADMIGAWRRVSARAESASRAEAEIKIFNQMVVALDGWFMHRLRSQEGKDGNPLNEVRLIAAGIAGNRGVFPVDATIRWTPETSVTGLRPGDPIQITEALFVGLCAAFLEQLTAKFTD